MKLRKIMAGIIATSVAGTMAVAASAQYDAFLMYADADWYPSIMDGTGHTEGNDGTVTEWTAGTAEVTKDGTYTVSIADIKASGVDEETGEETMGAVQGEGAVVFNVDIADLGTALGIGKDCEGYDDLKTGAEKMEFAKSKGVNVTDVKISQTKDGETTEVAVDSSKILFGDIEGNGKLRVELYNDFGDTKADAPLKVSDIFFNEKLEVTFTISGIDAILNGGSTTPDETDAPATDAPATDAPATEAPTAGDSTKDNTNTGVEGVAAVAGVAIVAAGAVIVAKKRK